MDKANTNTKVALDCLGCKLNQAETEAIARQLTEAGYHIVSPAERPDVYILNTCTVTHIADRKSRHLLRMAHRQSPGASLVAIGCYAQRAPPELSRIEGVKLILGNEQKAQLLRHLEDSGCLNRPTRRDLSCDYDGQRTRSFIKVQDGCGNFCAYCIVPLVRSKENSIPVDRIVSEVRQSVAHGNQEIVLTGTKVGSYSDDGANLPGLLKQVLTRTEVTRLRLSSLQPQEISSELLGLWRDERLCPHFHLSLQSGSDSVLRRMKRRYSTADYHQAISLIRKIVPGAAITTDVIVGFPGETETEFQDSFNFCQQIGFARIHVFPYSPRQGTEAAGMPHQTSDRVKKERSQKMLALAEASAQRFRQGFLGKTMPVLWEKQTNGAWSGLTGNYIKVYAENDDNLANKLLPVKLIKVHKDGVWGEIR